MIRSMFTAINALSTHQYFMDVVADNLANANTIGFKSSQVTFQSQFAQLLRSGAAPSGELGGINLTQIGLGTRLGSITPNFTQGMLQSTGRSTDLAIQGDGFFIYSDGTNMFYSRDGSLAIDAEGYLVNGSNGGRLQGWEAIAGVVDTGLPIGSIQLPLNSTLARATANAILGGNLDSSTTIGDTYDATVGVYDSLGVLHSVDLTFTRTADDTWDWSASGSGATGSGTVTFDAEGQYASGSGTITVPGTDGADATVFDLDLSGLTQLATESDASALSQDGLAPGSFSSFYVTSDNGEVYGLYSNGMQQLIGQLSLAKFANPTGLTRVGQNLYQTGLNSGEPVVSTAGSGGLGSVVGGYLEGSNVDLAREFTNMILAQRGFQASSRVITTSDEMLQELVNLKR